MSTKRNNYQAASSQSLNTQASSQAWEELTDKQAEAVRGGIDLNDLLRSLESGTSGQWFNTEVPGVFKIESGSGGLGGTQGQTGTGTFEIPTLGTIRINWGNFNL
jgi:hypothetical protein